MDREVWVVFPPTARRRIAEVRDRLRRECDTRSWPRPQEKTFPERRVRGRPLGLLAGSDAANLYRRSHRARVGVFFVGQPCVLLKPDAHVFAGGALAALRRFVRYKAYVSPLPEDPADVSGALDVYDAWCGRVECGGGRDPRCLPFHIFKSDQMPLGTTEQQQRFDGKYGSGARRRDDDDFVWILDPARFHGADVLHVAGYELAPGFHWDVSVGRGRKIITTPTERWRVDRYVNVAPDAHLRGRAPHARKIGSFT